MTSVVYILNSVIFSKGSFRMAIGWLYSNRSGKPSMVSVSVNSVISCLGGGLSLPWPCAATRLVGNVVIVSCGIAV